MMRLRRGSFQSRRMSGRLTKSISAIIYVRMVVDDRAAIPCIDETPLPFGIDQAVDKAIRQWHFRRFHFAGRIAPVTSMFAFEFRPFDSEEWTRIQNER